MVQLGGSHVEKSPFFFFFLPVFYILHLHRCFLPFLPSSFFWVSSHSSGLFCFASLMSQRAALWFLQLDGINVVRLLSLLTDAVLGYIL